MIQEAISLLPYNTFHIDAKARYFSAFASVNELSEVLKSHGNQLQLVIGGGSNILLANDLDGLVLKNAIQGIEKQSEDENYIYVCAGGGENWNGFVQYCVDQQWAGVENLTLIPGSVGASPIQNIGAYGVEVKDVIHEVRAYHIGERSNYRFKNEDCLFGYRESIFKQKYKGQFIITQVVFRLRKQPDFNTSYGAINQQLEKMGVETLSLRAVSNAVATIRSSKLPDPANTGNAGSFFKNPVVTAAEYEGLKEKFPEIAGYVNANGSVKLSAGWLIEHSGPAEGVSWKGFRRGDVGCYPLQALVLVNYGQASGPDIWEFGQEIIASVSSKFGVTLEPEVNVVG